MCMQSDRQLSELHESEQSCFTPRLQTMRPDNNVSQLTASLLRTDCKSIRNIRPLRTIQIAKMSWRQVTAVG